MTPQAFLDKWKLKRSELAILLSLPQSSVNHWFSTKSRRDPQIGVLAQLELVDSLWSIWKMQREFFPPTITDLYELSLSRLETASEEEPVTPEPLPQEFADLVQLVSANWETLQDLGCIPDVRLESFLAGHKPSDADIIRIASSLELSEDFVRELAQGQPKGEKQNGEASRIA